MPAQTGGSITRPTEEAGTLLLVLSGAAFLVPFMGSAVNVALPAIGDELGASAVELNWVVTSYLVASAVLLVPFGRLADLLGRRAVFLAGSGLHAVLSLACATTTSPAALIGLRAAQGASAAMSFSTAVALLIAAFPAASRGRALGINVAAVYVGLSLGPVVGGVLTQHLGWRSIFVLAAALGALVTWGTTVKVAAEPRRPGRFDVPGALLWTLSLAALMVGLATLTSHAAAPWAVAAGLAGLTGFVLVERRAAAPVLDLRLLAIPTFALSNLAALLHYAATFAVGFLLSLYLQIVRGLSPQVAGALLIAQPILMAALSPAAGRLSDRIEPRVVASIGMALTALGLGVLALLGAATPLLVVIAALVVIGVGFALFSSPNTNAVMSSVGGGDLGVASATLATMRLVGQALSMSMVALVLALHLGDAPIGAGTTAELIAGSRVSFALLTLLCALGVPASLARGTLRARLTIER